MPPPSPFSLNAINLDLRDLLDILLHPPNLLLLLSTTLWTLAYILYTHHALTSHTYGLPLLSLFLHFSWKITYTIIYPPSFPEKLISLPWLGAGFVLAGLTAWEGQGKGKGYWGGILRRDVGLVVVVVVGGVVAQVVFKRWVGRGGRGKACFWSGYACQVLVSWESVGMVVGRGSVRGGSMGIWWCRFLGTSCVTALCEWKYWHYPEDYAWIGTPLATFLLVATATGDMIYPFVFCLVERIKTGAPIPPHDSVLHLLEILLDIRARVWSFIASHPSDVAGAVFVAVTWYILTAILWRLDNISKLLEAQGLRKPWNLDEVQQKGEEQLGTWTERDVDSGTLDEGLRQTIVRQTKKPRIIEVKRSASLDVKVDDRADHRPATL